MRNNKFCYTTVTEEQTTNMQIRTNIAKEKLRERILNVDDNSILIGGKPQTLIDLYEEISRDWCGK